jgi:hypothetical protein
MPKHPTSFLALFVTLAILSAAPAIAADGQVTITQAKANAGNVTPGDAPGFPVTLSLPGSYILASNLQPPANKAGIPTTGIYGADFNSVTIRNGTITGFAAHGIYGFGNDWTVEDMRVVENGAYGIVVVGFSSSVRGSTVAENGNVGIYCGQNCLVEDSISSGNGVGIYIDSGTVLGNVIIANTFFGIQGFTTGRGNNTLVENNSNGLQTTGGGTLHPNYCDGACP